MRTSLPQRAFHPTDDVQRVFGKWISSQKNPRTCAIFVAMPLKTTDWEKGTHVGGYSVVIDVRTPNEWQVTHGGGRTRARHGTMLVLD
jgi:hypothetical protein